MNLEKQKVVNADGATKLKNKFREIDKKLKPSKGIGLINQENKKDIFEDEEEKYEDKKEIEIIDITEKNEEKKETTSFVSFEDMFKDGE